MTKREVRELKRKQDELFSKINNKGEIIAESTIDKQNKYILLDNTVWYCLRGQYPNNYGTLTDFTISITNNKIKAKFIDSEINK